MKMTQHTPRLGLEEEGFPLSVLAQTLHSDISYKCCVVGPGVENDVDKWRRLAGGKWRKWEKQDPGAGGKSEGVTP